MKSILKELICFLKTLVTCFTAYVIFFGSIIFLLLLFIMFLPNTKVPEWFLDFLFFISEIPAFLSVFFVGRRIGRISSIHWIIVNLLNFILVSFYRHEPFNTLSFFWYMGLFAFSVLPALANISGHIQNIEYNISLDSIICAEEYNVSSVVIKITKNFLKVLYICVFSYIVSFGLYIIFMVCIDEIFASSVIPDWINNVSLLLVLIPSTIFGFKGGRKNKKIHLIYWLFINFINLLIIVFGEYPILIRLGLPRYIIIAPISFSVIPLFGYLSIAISKK